MAKAHISSKQMKEWVEFRDNFIKKVSNHEK